jgi:ATP-dependent Lhr-like helicase
VLLRWGEGYVEPVSPPLLPLHIAAQQLLALSLQEAGVGRSTWTEWLGQPFVLGSAAAEHLPAIVDHLTGQGFLADDSGVLGVGPTAEDAFGQQYFMELLSVFTSPPMFSVRHGRHEIGVVPDEALTARPAGLAAGGAHVLVLAGRSWAVIHVDWPRRVVQVEPADAPGVARWTGSGQPLGAVLARGIREVLTGRNPDVEISQRAAD